MESTQPLLCVTILQADSSEGSSNGVRQRIRFSAIHNRDHIHFVECRTLSGQNTGTPGCKGTRKRGWKLIRVLVVQDGHTQEEVVDLNTRDFARRFPVDQQDLKQAINENRLEEFVAVHVKELHRRQAPSEDVLKEKCSNLFFCSLSSDLLSKPAIEQKFLCWDNNTGLSDAEKQQIDAFEYRIEMQGSRVAQKLQRAAERAWQQQVNELSLVRGQYFSPQARSSRLRKYRSKYTNTLFLGEVSYDWCDFQVNCEESSIVQGVYVASSQGKRKAQEDAHVATKMSIRLGDEEKELEVTGVFDGHCGGACSEYVAEKIVTYLEEYLTAFNKVADEDSGVLDVCIWNALKIAFVVLSRDYELTKGGTTANVCLKIDNTLWVVNVGDSRALLIDEEGYVLQLSEDQKPQDPKYKKGIEKRGGSITNNRINGGLAMARALGDFDYGGKVSARPKITKYTLKAGKTYILVQYCDGVSDVMTTNHVGYFVYQRKELGEFLEQVAENLVAAAIQTFLSRDNVTVLIRKIDINEEK